MAYYKSDSQNNANPESNPKDRSENPAPSVSKTSKKFAFASLLSISLLIFLSIIPLGSAEVWSEAVILAVIFLLSGADVWFDRTAIEHRRLLTPLLILAGYSFAHGLITVLGQTNFEVYPAILPESFDPAASLWNAFKILAFALFLGLLFKSFRGRAKLLIWILLFTGNFFALFGIARFLFQDNIFDAFALILSPRLEVGIGFGTFFNQNHFAFLMLMVFGLNTGLLWYGKLSKGARFVLLLASLTVWAALVLTGSRGGIIGSFAEIAVLIFLPVILTVALERDGRKKPFSSKIALAGRQTAILAVIFGLLVVGIVLIGQDWVVERFEDLPEQLGGVTNAATFRRTDIWQAALAIIKDYPVFGVGFGGFYVAVSQYIDISGQLVPKQAHNDYLELAASGGIIAVALTLWFALRFFALVGKRLRASSDSFSRAARIGAICGMAGIAVHSFFDFGLQMTANLLFFAGLLFAAAHEPENKREAAADLPPERSSLLKILFSAVCLILAGCAAFFGFARRQFEQAQISPTAGFVENSTLKIPFDAAYYEARAAVYENLGDAAGAVRELKEATRRRPKDYRLWLKLAEIEQSQNRPAEAENAFRRAAALAPLYGEPHFFYGKFLLKTGRPAEGFASLRLAAQRNPQYFSEVIGLLWQEKSGNAGETIKLLAPLNTAERERLVSFLLEKEEFPAIRALTCREEDFSEPNRDGLVRQLLEKKRFFAADRIYKRNCDSSEAVKSEIEDAGFDNKNVREGTGLGWRIGLSDNTSAAFDQGKAAGGQSLRFDFNGQEDSFALLSQIVTVEKNRRYQLRFSYQTNKLVTGGVPVLQVILKHADAENLLKETKLSPAAADWVQSSIEFETDARAEAIEIRLARQSCEQSVCPIFGSLWLDDFSLQKKN